MILKSFVYKNMKIKGFDRLDKKKKCMSRKINAAVHVKKTREFTIFECMDRNVVDTLINFSCKLHRMIIYYFSFMICHFFQAALPTVKIIFYLFYFINFLFAS